MRDHRPLQVGDPFQDRLIEGEVEQPREFPPRHVEAWGTQPEEVGVPDPEPEQRTEKSGQPRGPDLLRRRHLHVVDATRMGRHDELVFHRVDVVVVGRRDAARADDQRGRVGRQPHGRRHRRIRRRRNHHHRGRDADRHRHPGGGTPNIPHSQCGRQSPDATDVPFVTHRRSSICVTEKRWPPRWVSSSGMGIVGPLRCDEPSSAPLQFRPVSAR